MQALGQAVSATTTGARRMSNEPHDASRSDEYEERAKQSWGAMPQWAEYEQRWAGKTKADKDAMGERLMSLFVPFGEMAAAGVSPACDEAQDQVEAIQRFITENAYTCTNDILAYLGRAYGAGGEFTHNINEAAGPGAAEFASMAVEIYCSGD